MIKQCLFVSPYSNSIGFCFWLGCVLISSKFLVLAGRFSNQSHENNRQTNKSPEVCGGCDCCGHFNKLVSWNFSKKTPGLTFCSKIGTNQINTGRTKHVKKTIYYSIAHSSQKESMKLNDIIFFLILTNVALVWALE